MKKTHYQNYRQMCQALENYPSNAFEVSYTTDPGNPARITGCTVIERQEGAIIERMTLQHPFSKPCQMSENGVSTCPEGFEKYSPFNPSHRPGQEVVQYEYRDDRGRLFTCVAPTLERCRLNRDVWLRNLTAAA